MLSVIDQYTRECVALVADRRMTGAKVATILEQTLSSGRVQPESITTDNGSEFVSKSLDAWTMKRGSSWTSFAPANRLKMASSRAFMADYETNV